MNVVIVGAGRLGGSLEVLLKREGHAVRLVRRGETLPPRGTVWLAVRDAEIATLAGTIPEKRTVLHSSGSFGLEVFGDRRNCAALHPLMSFPGVEIVIPATKPAALLEGRGEGLRSAVRLADSLGWTTLKLRGDRVLYHAAACMAAGQIARHFLDAAEVFAEAVDVDADAARRVLGMLALGALRSAVESGERAITGPAVRGDLATIEAHRSALPPALLGAYDALTARILAGRRSDP